MNKKQAILLISLLLIFNIQGISQVNFRIILDNYTDSSVLLTSYYGDKIKLVDTVYVNGDVFEFNDKNYPGGIYILADASKKKLFEFIINDESDFTIFANTKTPSEIKAEGSKENELFFNHLLLRNKAFEIALQLKDTSSDTTTKLTEKKTETQLDSLRTLLHEEELMIINAYPDLFIAKLIVANREINIPESIAPDSLQKFLYYKAHFWDGFDLKDKRFIRTPIIDKKLETYFDNIVYLHPDSTINAIDLVISNAHPSEEMVSYILWYFMAKYQNPQYMGFDRVFVHLVDNYFLREDVLNTTASINEKLKERSDKLKPLLIGEPAPDLLLIDTNDRFVSFRDFESDFTVLLFWDYNCNVCEDEIAELQSLIDTTIYNISVYAINTNRNIDQWKDVVSLRNMNWYHVNGTKSMTANFYNLYDINGTPRLFLLDDEKKIIAKHFKVAQLIPIIENQFMKSKL
jgi:peroxiredoxin